MKKKKPTLTTAQKENCADQSYFECCNKNIKKQLSLEMSIARNSSLEDCCWYELNYQ